MPHIDIETAGQIIGSLHNTVFACPHCGHKYDGGDSEIAPLVVTYWGDDGDHKLCCDDCGKDFVVRENVMRSFQTGATSDDIDAI